MPPRNHVPPAAGARPGATRTRLPRRGHNQRLAEARAAAPSYPVTRKAPQRNLDCDYWRNKTRMVKIRLRRTGKTKQPSYRVVVADSRSPRDGKFIEIIGHYNPIRQPKVLEIKADRARYWLSVGAQPTETVVKLLQRVNVLDEHGRPTPAPAEV